MRLYSGKRDEGKSSLRDGNRIYKDEPVFELMGSLDELSSDIGMAISFCLEENQKTDLETIQTKLSELMGFIADPAGNSSNQSFEIEKSVAWIEERIQTYGQSMEPMRSFIHSGKTTLGASLDVCRTVTRRAERAAVRYMRQTEKVDPQLLIFLNRLSSLFFALFIFIEKN